MKPSRFTVEQIAHALRRSEAGTPATEICRELGVTQNTFYRWKRKFGGLGTPELRELRQLREDTLRKSSEAGASARARDPGRSDERNGVKPEVA